MAKMKRILTAVLFICLIIAVVACGELPVTPAGTPTVTLHPGFIETPQAAYAQAQSTLAAGEGRMAELSVEGTEVAMQMTQAAATDLYLRQQTADSQTATDAAARLVIDLTSTAQAAAATYQARETQAHFDLATESAAATSDANQAIMTQVAMQITQAAAQAEIERIIEQRLVESQTLLWRTWSGRIFGAILTVLIIAVIGYVSWRIWPVILTRLGVVRWAPDGKPYFTAQLPGRRVVLVDLTRALAPGIVIEPDGTITQGGGAQDEQIQNQVTARAQTAEMLLAANTLPATHAKPSKTTERIVSGVLQTGQPTQRYIVLSPSDSQGKLDPSEREILDAEWRDADEPANHP